MQVVRSQNSVKPIHIVIFVICCGLYLLLLLFVRNQKKLETTILARHVRSEGLVASFGHCYASLDSLVESGSRNIQLIEALSRTPQKKKAVDSAMLIAQIARFFNPRLSHNEAVDLGRLIAKTAKRYNIDPLFMAALISQESAFYEKARSPVGAFGYGQLMPDTARYLGVDINDPEQNLEGCAKYLSEHFQTWAGHEDAHALVLASYNAGPGAVAHYRGVPPYRETRTYVQIVHERYLALKEASKRNL